MLVIEQRVGGPPPLVAEIPRDQPARSRRSAHELLDARRRRAQRAL